MKNLFLTLFVLFSLSPVFGQTKNVDLDNVRLSITTRSTPAEPLDPLFFHYSSKVTATSSTKQRVDIEDVNHSIYIAGEKKVKNPMAGDVLIHVDLGNLVIASSNIVERKEESKQKDGTVNVSYYYKVEVNYKFDSNFKIIRDDKILAQETVYSSYSSQYYTSQEYGSRKGAADFWNNNRDILISDFTRDLSMRTASRASSVASYRYGFPVTKSYDIIKTIDEKKHNENEAFRGAAQALKEELSSMTGETGMNKDRINGLIEYFESIPKKYTDPKLKADVRLRYAAYYNLCKIYLYLDEPEKIIPYADLILSNGHDKKDEERMKKAADSLKVVLDRTSIKTRHFDPNEYFKNDTQEGIQVIQKEEVQTKEDESDE